MTTYEQYVCLVLAKRRAAAELARAGVIAGDVLNGAIPPLEWFMLDGQTPEEAARLHSEALLKAYLKRHPRGRN